MSCKKGNWCKVGTKKWEKRQYHKKARKVKIKLNYGRYHRLVHWW